MALKQYIEKFPVVGYAITAAVFLLVFTSPLIFEGDLRSGWTVIATALEPIGINISFLLLMIFRAIIASILAFGVYWNLKGKNPVIYATAVAATIMAIVLGTILVAVGYTGHIDEKGIVASSNLLSSGMIAIWASLFISIVGGNILTYFIWKKTN